MRLIPITVFAIILTAMIMSGCRRSHSDVGQEDKPVEYEEGLSMKAWQMQYDNAPFDEYFAVQLEAVRQLRAGESREDPVAVLEQTAYFLFSAGRLEEALPYFEEAIDSLHAHPGTVSESVIQLYGDLSQYYERLGMIDHAIAYSDSAMEESRRLDGAMMGDLWRFRTQIYANRGRTAEAFACLDSAGAAIRRYYEAPDTTFMLILVGADRANLILSLNPSRDSLEIAAALLRKTRADFVGPDALFYAGAYGQALYLRGDREEGIRLMEEAVDGLRDIGDVEMTFMEMRRLIETYTAEKMYDRVGNLYDEYTELSDSMSRARHDMDLVIAKVRADVAAKERENRTLHRELESQRSHTALIICLSLLIAIAAAGIFIAGRRRIRRIRRAHDDEYTRRLSAEANASEALTERDSALERIEAIKGELSEGNTAPDILSRPQPFGNNTAQFTRAFNAIYPDYADGLRHDYPSLTDTDLLFCMLIYLRHSTEDISVYLNISRASVNSARYRIRTKLGLAKGDSLDNFLQQR